MSLSAWAETIVAPITGVGGAVAVLRLSGPDAWRIAQRMMPSLPESPIARHAYYGEFAHGDDGLCVLFEEGASYTGEPAAELSVHGSVASVQTLQALCLHAGARSARAGEFTERAFLNGRLDLSQAEAVRDTVAAQTERQLRMANLLRSGGLRERLGEIVRELEALLAAVEASVDFSEEIGEFDAESGLRRLAEIDSALTALLATGEKGRILRQGLRVALLGAPNAGKSSLLNALVGRERSIVTEVPGTTRDLVEEAIDLGGLPVVLIDTAGLRETDDRVEAIGVRLAWEAAAMADAVWYLYDAQRGWTAEDAAQLEALKRPYRILASKADLSPVAEGPGLRVSARTGEGLDALVASIRKEWEGIDGPLIDPRHGPALMLAREAVAEARATLEHDRPADLLSVCLREALASIGQITGETASADMIERIFQYFCIGK